jgi:MFS family permease
VTARLGRQFNLLFSASVISTLGNGISLTALPLLAARLSHNPVYVALIASAGHLPWLVFGLVTGAIVDRGDRRRLMWLMDAFRAVLVGLLAVGVALHVVSIVVLMLVAFILGTAGTLFDGAAQAMVPAVVPAETEPLQRASGRLFGAQIVGEQFVGPAAGGAMFGLAAAIPFAADAVSFVGSAALLGRIKGRYRAESAGQASVWRDVREGIAWLWRHPLLRTLAVLVAVVNMGAMLGEATLVLYATRLLHLSSAGFGLVIASAAVGGVLASVTAPQFAPRLGEATALRVGLTVSATGTAIMSFAPNAIVAGLALALSSYAATLFNVAGAPLRQMLVPDRLRGRVISAFRVLALGSIPIGGVIGGAIASALGLRAPFAAGAVLLAISAAVAWRTITPGVVAAARAEIPATSAPAVQTG